MMNRTEEMPRLQSDRNNLSRDTLKHGHPGIPVTPETDFLTLLVMRVTRLRGRTKISRDSVSTKIPVCLRPTLNVEKV